jgi:hypothetical protein
LPKVVWCLNDQSHHCLLPPILKPWQYICKLGMKHFHYCSRSQAECTLMKCV